MILAEMSKSVNLYPVMQADVMILLQKKVTYFT